MCGKNYEARRNAPDRKGSPPRVQGKPTVVGSVPAVAGITPACAGKTDTGCAAREFFWDHPRVCGENLFAERAVGLFEGSPPRVRGKRSKEVPELKAPGITPACAGKTQKVCGLRLLWRDHPRVCGENTNLETFSGNKKGSPPRVRGKPALRRSFCAYSGITPACAGKTLYRSSTDQETWDHPRVCGENLISPKKSLLTLGSPPRVRGKPIRSARVS